MDPAKIDFLGATNVHPMDILEPEPEDIREQDRLRSVQVMFLALDAMKSARRWDVGFHQVSYALGHATEPMAEVAARLGVERATLSAGAVSLCKALDIPPSASMRSEDARQAYHDSRTSKLDQ
tara:strand:- start:264 stop:632 length:369 start_codon:yes stop_codon:yes gene_type:complete